MYIQVVYLEVQPENMEAFLGEVIANVQASRQEAGVVQFDLLRQVNEPSKFMLYEVYRSPEDLDAHRATPHFQRWIQFGVPLLAGERIRVIYEPVV